MKHTDSMESSRDIVLVNMTALIGKHLWETAAD